MIQSLPFTPLMDEKWLVKFFKKNYFKKPYNKFMWWRSYTAKKKPLPNKASFLDKCKNGDQQEAEEPEPFNKEHFVVHDIQTEFKSSFTYTIT